MCKLSARLYIICCCYEWFRQLSLVRENLVKVNSRNLFIRAVFFVSPLWLLLALHAYGAGGGTAGSIFAIFHLPGFALMLLFNPTWGQLHNYEPWHYLIGDFVFYYLVVLLVLYLTKRFRLLR